MIYLDNASTTIPNEITNFHLCNYNNFFGNPSNIYSIGREVHQKVEHARAQVAKAINADAEDIYFTSGASESNAWAIRQCDKCYCSPFEHHSIIANPSVKSFNDSYKEFTNMLFSHMLVNNESGEIFYENVVDICKAINCFNSNKKISRNENNFISFYTHTDATQAIGNVPVDVKDLGVDMLSLSGHKIHAPKGIGVLYINHNTIPANKIKPLIYGTQENNCRGGTENTLGIICLGDCIEAAVQNIEKKREYCRTLKEIVINKLIISKLDWKLNTPFNSITSTINFSLKNMESEVIASILSDENIYVGVGSACNTGLFEPSQVLKAMGVTEEYIRGSIRLSFDVNNTQSEVEYVMDKIIKIYKDLKGN